MKNRLEIDILDSISGVDADRVRLECCKDTLIMLKKYSDGSNTSPKLLLRHGRKYRFVGVPLVINNRVYKEVLRLRPRNYCFYLGDYFVI